LIGGAGLTVEIDESLFSKSKNNGHILPEQWVFGGICQETRVSLWQFQSEVAVL
jgi:hypothetical protein